MTASIKIPNSRAIPLISCVPDYGRHKTSGTYLLDSASTDIIEVAVICNGGDLNATTRSLDQTNKYLVLFESFYYTLDGHTLTIPECYSEIDWIQEVKLRNHRLTAKETAQIFDHMLVWDYCIKSQNPLIIAESGTIFECTLDQHLSPGSLVSLSTDKPLVINKNYRCLKDVKAYSIHPVLARKLKSTILNDGILDCLNIMLRQDIYPLMFKKIIKCQ